MSSKKELYQVVKYRYQVASRAEKSKILDEFSANAGFNRKYAIRLLNEGYKGGKKKPGPKRKYGSDPEFCKVVRKMWKLLHYPSGRLLKPQLEVLIPFYEKHFKLIESSTKEKLLAVSTATLDRVLRNYKRRGKSTTKPGSLLRTEIPIQGCVWNESVPGFMEADTVAHCGTTTYGMYIHTLTLTDIATSWTECRAIFGKSAHNTLEAIQDIQKRLPFPLQGFDSDNGTEFINQHLVRYLAEQNIRMTRSRPYRKDDNAHVEQKNYSFVRQLMGYGRMENPELIPVMNELYRDNWCLLKNFFTPCMKLVEKKRVGAKIIKKHDEPKTPYRRVLENPHVADENKQALTAIYEALDPIELSMRIDALSKVVRKLSRVSYDQWKNEQASAFH
ncbi:MAG: transposase family protein [Bdellovibrionales bacterium]|nr:transposase family protein [Bdellovibrionales bacterium]